MKIEKIYTAVATSSGARNGHVKSSDGLLDFELKVPKEMGGPGGAFTNPEQLFAAGYAACFGGALTHVALTQKIRIEPIITAKVSFGKDSEENMGLAVDFEIHIDGIDQKTAESLVAQAHQVCPYSRATRNNIEVTLKVTTDKK